MTTRPYPFKTHIAARTDLDPAYATRLDALIRAYAKASGMSETAAAEFFDGYYVARAELLLATLLDVPEGALQVRYPQ